MGGAFIFATVLLSELVEKKVTLGLELEVEAHFTRMPPPSDLQV